MPFGGLLTVGLIGAGAGLGGAAIAAHASGKAADQQSEASDKALALQQQMYQQNRADTAPWRQTGGKAVQTLGALMGLGGGSAQADVPMSLGGMYTPETMPPRGSSAGTALNDQGQFVPLNPNIAHAPGGNWSGDSDASSYGNLTHGGFQGFVRMQAPDGTIQSVPPSAVEHYLSLGAVRI